MRRLLLLLALGSCFEEETTPRDAAARQLVGSLAAFADIQANLTTDPAAAGAALTEFLKAPVAAGAILDQPFDPGTASARVARIAPLGIPECLQTTGTTGCDGFTTTAECEAGPFRFTGTASRTCSPCEAVTGSCQFEWDLTLHDGTPDFTIDLETATLAPVSIDATHIQIDTTMAYTATLGAYTESGNIRVCSCGDITLNAAHVPVSSSLVVKDAVGSARCALIELDATGTPTISNACSCTAGGCE